MIERPILAVIAALAAGSFFSLGTHVPQEALAYGMPSVSGVTFQVSDTMAISVQSPMGPMDLKALARATLTVGFEADPGGFRATAEDERHHYRVLLLGCGGETSPLGRTHA